MKLPLTYFGPLASKLRFAVRAAFVILAFGICVGASEAATVDRTLAVVGDQPILLSEVVSLKNDIAKTPALVQAYRLKNSSPTLEEVLNLKIDDQVIEQTTRALDVVVSDAEVNTQIASIAKTNKMSVAQLEVALRNEGISMDLYRRNIRAQASRRAIYDRELRQGGGISENDLRATYERGADEEVKLSLLALKKSPQARKFLTKLAGEVNSGKVPLAQAIKQNSAESLGWTSLVQLDEKISRQLKGAKTGRAIGPIEVQKQLQVVFVEDNRKGSAEGFERRKEELMMQAQAKDYERRINFWLERKKRETNIVINRT